jgi:CRP/FNR family transcriptional regulator, cyclic AMP receptor protein
MIERSAAMEIYGRLLQDGGAGKVETMENKVWYLRQNRLFNQATEQGIVDVEHIFTMCEYPRKTQLFDQGDPTRLVYLIKRGKVRINRITPDGKEVTIAILGAGDLFGEETLFETPTRTTVATVIEDALICTAKADDLFGLLARDPRLALNVAQILSERLLDASATMEDLAYARIPDRLMHLFSRLASEHGTESPEGIVVDVRLTHADIASLIGSTRETVSLEMSNLVKAGRIRMKGRSIVIPHEEILP